MPKIKTNKSQASLLAEADKESEKESEKMSEKSGSAPKKIKPQFFNPSQFETGFEDSPAKFSSINMNELRIETLTPLNGEKKSLLGDNAKS